MLRALAASWKPHVWVNVHSGMEALFMPYDHRAEVLATATDAWTPGTPPASHQRLTTGSPPLHITGSNG